MESKIYIAQAEEMRRQGKTYREIGEHFGVTYERVRQVLAHIEPQPRYFNAVQEKACVYPRLRDWMNRNMVSPYRLAAMMGYKSIPAAYTRLKERLAGRSEFRMRDIMGILEVTGMTFEEAFGDGN